MLDPSLKSLDCYSKIKDSDFKIEWFNGTIGAGGQHRNKHANSIKLLHIPTGILETRQGRKRESNLREAKEAILIRLEESSNNYIAKINGNIRKDQIGSGMRGDKTVTIRFQDDKAINHITGLTMKASRYMKGYMNEIWS